jgi:hypothetical protein
VNLVKINNLFLHNYNALYQMSGVDLLTREDVRSSRKLIQSGYIACIIIGINQLLRKLIKKILK